MSQLQSYAGTYPGYYSLISGYKNPISYKPSKLTYGVTFEEIVAFYYFDEKLRTFYFKKYILHIGWHLKSSISYHSVKIR